MLLLAIYSTIAVLVLFVASGMYLVVRSLSIAAREQRRERGLEAAGWEGLRLKERIKRYVGPVKPEMALLNPPARVGIEFFSSLCGFPGLGWLISGRVAVGLLLFSVGPILTWAVYPMYLSVSNQIMAGPYVALRYLPVLAFTSAGLLAISQFRARKRRGEEANT